MSVEDMDELRARLNEAEETLRAIREGQVDALVIETPDAAEIFTIEGEGESYRTFMEAMDVGAAAVDGEGRILYLNANLAAVLGAPMSAVQGRRFEKVVDATAATAIEGVLTAEGATVQIRLKQGSGEAHYLVSAKPMRLGTMAGFAVTFTDVTHRVAAEIALQSERAARAVIASANEAVLVCDRHGVVTHANLAAQNVYHGDPVGQPFATIVPLTFSGVGGMVQSSDLVEMAIAGTAVQGIDAHAPNAPRQKDYQISAAPLQVGEDEISGCVITMVDMSQRKAAEKQQLLLMRELDHRVKNTLALVLSIAGRTLHHEDTLEGYHKAFTGRVQALAATHNLLAENSWTDLTIAEVVHAELAPYAGSGTTNIRIEGLDRPIAPRAAIAFGMVIHELATNAVKYGALSTSHGRIDVIAVPAKANTFDLEWRESGGPPVDEPTRRGFGQSVISRSLQYSDDSGARVEFRPDGVVCHIALPKEDLR